MFKNLKICTAAMFLAFTAQTASANIIQADFNETLDSFSFSSGPKVLHAEDRAVVAGPELTEAADLISNPSSWRGALTVDLHGDLLTLSSVGLDFQTTSVSLTDLIFDLAGEIVVDVTLITESIINPLSPNFTEEVLFTPGSITLNFLANDGSRFNFVANGSATYQITTRVVDDVAVPASAPLGLVLLGLASFGLIRRRQA